MIYCEKKNPGPIIRQILHDRVPFGSAMVPLECALDVPAQ
jgi:hypothetical protein